MEMLHEAEFWEAVGFVLVIALLLWKGAPGMVAKILDQRAAVISAELEEARRLRAEAAALLSDYQKRAASAEAEARSIVDAATADAVVTYRTEQGGFKTIDDLKKVPGIDGAKIEARKDRLMF